MAAHIPAREGVRKGRLRQFRDCLAAVCVDQINLHPYT